MTRVVLGIVAGLAIGAAGTSCVLMWRGHLGLALQGRDALVTEREAEEPAEGSFVQQEADGRTSIRLDQDTRTRMGLKVQPLAAVEVSPEMKGYGRVLDPAPLAALVVEAASARASLEASSKEFERLRTLYSQSQNVSAHDLETAEAAMKHDQVQLESVQLRLVLGWGKAIASQADLPAFVHSLVAQEAAVIRVDLAFGETLTAPPVGGRIAPLAAPEALAEAQYLGPAPSADTQTQSLGVLFLMKITPLVPGTAVLARLTLPGPAQSGVIVPRDALLHHEGRTFVYLQVAEDSFERQAVTLGRPSGDGWFVGEGFKPGDKLVIVGAQQLLSEELKGQGGGEE